MNTELKTHSRFSTWLYSFTIFLFLLHFEVLLPFKALAQSQDVNTIDLDLPFSSVSFEISDFTGGAHLNYPIVVPPARDGLAPNLSFSYTSTGGNSWVGIGWDLSAGFIQRRGVKKGVPKYNDTDVFELQLGSGSPQELVSIGGGEYRLKIEGAFLKIKFNSAGNYWEVWDKSGVKMKFGSATNSRIGKVKEPLNYADTYRWFLDQVQDPKTNYMELSYFRDQDTTNTYTYQIYLQEIKYNGQAGGGLPHNHSVLFNLESTNPIYNYRGGFMMLTRKRLSSIEVKTNDALVRKYKLQYKEPFSDVASYNARSLLSQVTLYDKDDTASLPPTKFYYQEIDNSNTANRGFGEAVSWDHPSGSLAIRGYYTTLSHVPGCGGYVQNNGESKDGYEYGYDCSCSYMRNDGITSDVIDMNGDGLPDRVVDDGTPPLNTWTVYPNNGNGFGNATDWPNPSSHNLLRTNESITGSTLSDVIDMNGDGLPDRVVYSNPWLVYLNNGTSFNQPPIQWPNSSDYIRRVFYPTHQGQSYATTVYDLIDMNGDGLPDRVDATPAPYNGFWNVYLNNGSGFDQQPIQWPISPDYSANFPYIRYTSFPWPTGYDQTIVDLIDMNGDGLPDRVWTGQSSLAFPSTTWKVYFNKGNGFEANGVDWPVAPVNEASLIRLSSFCGTWVDLIDMNGDGLPDQVVKVPPSLKVYLNTGKGFGPGGIDYPDPYGLSCWGWPSVRCNLIGDLWGYCEDPFPYIAGIASDIIDINRDGLPDRVVYNSNCSPPNCPWSVNLNKGPVSDLLSKVENGIGGTIQLTYAPSTLYTNHYLPFVVQTVKSVSVNDGNGLISTTNYTYGGGYYRADEKEFRGFEYVKQTKPDMTTVGTWYYQDKKDDPFDNQCPGCKGQPYEQQIKDASGNLYTLTNYFYTPTSPYPGVTFPGLTRKDDIIYDGTSTPKWSAISFEYDSYGNIKRTYSHGEVVPETGEEIPGDEKDENTEYQCVNDATQYVCRPSHKFTKDSSGAIKSQSWYTYYTKNQCCPN